MDTTLSEILDHIYSYLDRAESLTVRVGIWDYSTTTYTVYATLHDEDGNTLYGESTYGSNTVDEALRGLLDELQAVKP